MDNKQDRQFYWEVKNFLNKNHEPAAPKPVAPNLQETAKMVYEKNNVFKQSSFNSKIESQNKIDNLVNYIAATNKKAEPLNPARAKTVHSNPFGMIKEGIFDTAIATSNRQGGQSLPSSRNLNIAAQSAPQASTTPSQSYQLPDGTWVDAQGNPIQGAPTAAAASTPSPVPPMFTPGSSPAGMPTPGNVPTTSPMSSEDIIDQLRDARGMPKGDRGGIGNKGRGERERALNQAERAARSESLKDAGIAATRERERLRDEVREARKKVKETSNGATVEVEGPPGPGGTQPTATRSDNLAAQEELKKKTEALRKFNERSGYNQGSPQQGNIKPSDIALRYAEKPGTVRAMPDETRIQGTNMTYGEFKQKTGRDYNPFNQDDSSLAIRMGSQSSAGRYSSQEAKDLAIQTSRYLDKVSRTKADSDIASKPEPAPEPEPTETGMNTTKNPPPPIRARNRKDRNILYPG